jgi:kojibiose phosphorylase
MFLAQAGGAIEAFQGWRALPELDVREYAKARAPLQRILGLRRVEGARVAKQADVVLLCHLLRDRIDLLTAARCFDEYEPRCDPEGSSLSPAIHAAVAARLGRDATASRYLERAAAIDFDGERRDGGGGVHTAACGGLWQAVVFGALGATATARALVLAPRLLRGWDALDVALKWRGATLRIGLTRAGTEIKVAGGASRVRLRVGGRDLDMGAGERRFVETSDA